jgi:large subunit ribosomal protein L6
MPITVPPGVVVNIEQDKVTISGPRGQLHRRLNPEMSITLENNSEGVTSGFEKTLDIVGVGYRAEKKGDNVVIHIGYSRPVEVSPLPGVSLVIESANRIKVTGINKEVVGEMAARIRAIRPPDAYKGKGIRYAGEIVHLKAGKTAKAIGSKE